MAGDTRGSDTVHTGYARKGTPTRYITVQYGPLIACTVASAHKSAKVAKNKGRKATEWAVVVFTVFTCFFCFAHGRVSAHATRSTIACANTL